MKCLFCLMVCTVFSNWSMISESRLVFLRDHLIKDRRSCLKTLTPADVLEVAVFASITDFERAQEVFYLCSYNEKDYGEVLKRIGASFLGEDSALKMAQWLMPYIILGDFRISSSDFNDAVFQGCRKVYYWLVKYFVDMMRGNPDCLSLGLDIQAIQDEISMRSSVCQFDQGDFYQAQLWLGLIDKLTYRGGFDEFGL
jgi:hypothetical protein